MLNQEYQSIYKIIDLLSSAINELKSEPKASTPSPILIKKLEQFYTIIQKTNSIILTDATGCLIIDPITSTTPVYGYGLRSNVGCQSIIAEFKEIYAIGGEEYTILPLTLLLNSKQLLNQANIIKFIEALYLLKVFFQQLAITN